MRLVFMMAVVGSLQASVMDSNGFTFGHDDTPGESECFIDGPQGRQTFHFGFHVDTWGTPIMNRFGQLVSYAETISNAGTEINPFIFYALYPYHFTDGTSYFLGQNGTHYFGGNGAGFIGVVPKWADFYALGYLPVPIPGDTEINIGKAVPLSISDDGLVTGEVTHFYQKAGWTTQEVQWQLPLALPEPSSLQLCVGGLILLAITRNRKQKVN